MRSQVRAMSLMKMNRAYQVVISRATIISSLTIRAVNEIATILRNSFSNRTSDMIMIAPPD
jgi:hypothetical protein